MLESLLSFFLCRSLAKVRLKVSQSPCIWLPLAYGFRSITKADPCGAGWGRIGRFIRVCPYARDALPGIHHRAKALVASGGIEVCE